MRHYLAFGLTSIAILVLSACDQQAPAVTKSETSAPQQESIAKAEPAAMAKQVAIPADKKHYSPNVGDTFPNNVFFGDTHLHTSYSTDAGMVGNTLGPEEAYRIARGETVKASFGEYVKLKRPLDFVVIADHAENLGLAPAISEGNPKLQDSEFGKKISKLASTPGKEEDAFDLWVGTALIEGRNPLAGLGLEQTYWQKSTAAAEKFNEPGKFTALIGFEWTSAPGGNNLHRNVIFRGDKSKADQIVPLASYDTDDPEKLWAWMADYEKKTGGKMLAIPHNGNVSQGLMFDDVTLTTKKPLDKAYAESRMRWEPLYEVTQMKGDGEAHPFLSPEDEFADFETWDTGSFGPKTTTKEHWPREYAREAFKRGLAYEKTLGANPFKFGLIGSTDSHTSVPSAEEDNYFGKVSLLEPGAGETRYEETIIGRPNPDKKSQITATRVSASGLAAVWARDNTREALWDAMKRKEVYGTTGTRLKVRVFGGFDFSAADIDRMDFAEEGYKRGVPMGGDLTTSPSGKAPGFLVRALRDPDGANIDRVQIIKGWLDAKGESQEKVYDLAVSDGRKIGADGLSKTPVGNTVNVKEASYSNSIGDAYQQAYWQDPAFDAKQKAFYYVRVIEIPTPRWTVYDAKHFGRELPHGVPTSIQERAYTSPIWYTPQ
ncbi:MAG: hypothetical protein ACI936_001753 [Paraglaciecola sp.]|jgi:hypothetical protein